MLDALALSDLSHGDRLQRELALTFARALHSHVCLECGKLRVCTVVNCEYRPFDRRENKRWKCCHGTTPEWASDEPGGGDE